MNIIIIREDDHHGFTLTGGEYCVSTVDIHVDKSLDIQTQRALVMHGIIEAYCPSWPHDKVDELEDLLAEGLEQLEVEEPQKPDWHLKKQEKK